MVSESSVVAFTREKLRRRVLRLLTKCYKLGKPDTTIMTSLFVEMVEVEVKTPHSILFNFFKNGDFTSKAQKMSAQRVLFIIMQRFDIRNNYKLSESKS